MLSKDFGRIEVVQIHTQVVRRATCLLELFKLLFTHEDDTGFVIFVPPAAIANVTEGEIQIFTSNTYPVSYSFVDCLFCLSIVVDWFFELRLVLFSRALFFLIHLWLSLLWFLALSKKVFRLAVEVLLWLLLETPVAFGPSVEVVVLTVAAHPAAIREVKLVFLLLRLLPALGLGILPRDHWPALHTLTLNCAHFAFRIFFVAFLSRTRGFFLDSHAWRIFFQKWNQIRAYKERPTHVKSKALKPNKLTLLPCPLYPAWWSLQQSSEPKTASFHQTGPWTASLGFRPSKFEK